MKKYIFAALLCCMMAAPTSARAQRVDIFGFIEVLFKRANDRIEQMRKQQQFFDVCVYIIEANKDFEEFNNDEILGWYLCWKIQHNAYTMDEAVEIIHRWWMDDWCWEILIEMPEVDDFRELMPAKYSKKYDFQ